MSATSPITQRLIQIPICKGLTEAEAGVLVEISEETTLSRGATLFSEGQAGDAIYAVLEGELEVVKGAGSHAQCLATVGPGAVLGEMSLLGGSAHRSASAVASTDARLLKISAIGFGRLLKSDNVTALKIVANLAHVMSNRLQMANEKLVELAGKAQRKEELMDFQKILSHWSF